MRGMTAKHVLWLVVLAFGCGVEHDLARGEDAISRRDLPKAEAAFRHVLERTPDRVEALYGLGWTYHLAGQPGSARPYFERCVEAHPESPLGYKGLGSVALAEENLALAEQRFQEALARAPEDAAILNSLALAWMKSGKMEQAIGVYESLRARDPTSVAVAHGYAEALLRRNRREEALQVVDDALSRTDKATPDRGLLLHLRARILAGLTANRVDPSDCAGTLPSVLAYLDEADAALVEADRNGTPIPELPQTRRLVLRRRGVVTEICPLRSWAPGPADDLGQ